MRDACEETWERRAKKHAKRDNITVGETSFLAAFVFGRGERWGAGVETPKNVREEIGGWGRVPFNEPYAPLLSTIYDGA